MPLVLQSKRDLNLLSEDYELEDENMVCRRTVFAAIDSDDRAYFGQCEDINKFDLTIERIREALEPVIDEEVYPQFASDLTIAQDDGTGHVKRPMFGIYRNMKGRDFLARLILQEARILELILQHPHPNIIRYHGCRVRRNRITGLVMDKYEDDLDFVEMRPDLFKGKIDKELIMSGVASAIEHLHSLGLAHNDLNPSNIMFGNYGSLS
jgi:serine/threonine protein kinase